MLLMAMLTRWVVHRSTRVSHAWVLFLHCMQAHQAMEGGCCSKVFFWGYHKSCCIVRMKPVATRSEALLCKLSETCLGPAGAR